MNTRTFIEKQKERIEKGETLRNGERYHASVLATDTVIYSYGTHYPLLFQIDTINGKKWVLNNAGYSNTTSKHIGYAGLYADIRVPLKSHYPLNFDTVYNSLKDKIESIKATMETKKRKDTAVYRLLENELAMYTKYLQDISFNY